MRTGFVHEALLELAPDSDERGPGAAVTVALCGHWEHEGPCRWPHHTAVAAGSERSLGLRVIFASSVEEEPEVRRLIRGALDEGRLDVEAKASRWTVITQRPSELRSKEVRLVNRLVGA